MKKFKLKKADATPAALHQKAEAMYTAADAIIVEARKAAGLSSEYEAENPAEFDFEVPPAAEKLRAEGLSLKYRAAAAEKFSHFQEISEQPSPAFLTMVSGMALSIVCFFLAPNLLAEGISLFAVNTFGALAIAVKIAKL